MKRFRRQLLHLTNLRFGVPALAGGARLPAPLRQGGLKAPCLPAGRQLQIVARIVTLLLFLGSWQPWYAESAHGQVLASTPFVSQSGHLTQQERSAGPATASLPTNAPPQVKITYPQSGVGLDGGPNP